MIDQDEISSLIPPDPEELDKPMGGTQSSEQKEIEEDHIRDNLEKDPGMYKRLKNAIEGNSSYTYEEQKEKLDNLKKIAEEVSSKHRKETQHSQENNSEGKLQHYLVSHFLYLADNDEHLFDGLKLLNKGMDAVKYENPNRLCKTAIHSYFENKHFPKYAPQFAIYPAELLDSEELKTPPIPDWSEVCTESWRKYPTFKPEFHMEFVDCLEPHVYWINEDEGFEYSINPGFVIPAKLKPIRVQGKQAFLSIRISEDPLLYIIIVFNAAELAPHEVLILASQMLPEKHMKKKNSPLYRTKESFQVFIAYNDKAAEGIGEFWPKEITVGFNQLGLHMTLELSKIEEIDRIKNTLYEDIFIHIWTHFFMDVLQTSQEAKYISNLALGMKHLFFDKFCKITFLRGANKVKQNLYDYEYWTAWNSTIRMERLEDFMLTFGKPFGYYHASLSEVSALEAAGVKGLAPRRQPTDEEWHRAIQETVDIMEGQKPLKKIKIHPPTTTTPKPSETSPLQLADDDDDDDFENNTH